MILLVPSITTLSSRMRLVDLFELIVVKFIQLLQEILSTRNLLFEKQRWAFLLFVGHSYDALIN